jgi:hypothetical protein
VSRDTIRRQIVDFRCSSAVGLGLRQANSEDFAQRPHVREDNCYPKHLAPWEPWVWNNVPKAISGPYLLYCAFALWHFQARWWLVSLVAIVGAARCAIALKDRRKPLRQSDGQSADEEPTYCPGRLSMGRFLRGWGICMSVRLTA